MRRRALLAAFACGAAGLSGCSLPAGRGGRTTDEVTPAPVPSPDESETATPDERDPIEKVIDRVPEDLPGSRHPENGASIVELETGPRTYAFRPSIRSEGGGRVLLWFDRTATADHPARLTGWLVNATDSEVPFVPGRLTVGERNAEPVDARADERIYLTPTENNELAEAVPSLARSPDGYWRLVRETAGQSDDWTADTYRMEPGELVKVEYNLVGSANGSGRPTGTYEFGQPDSELVVWNASSPGPERDSRFEGRDVPAFTHDRAVQWYHEADATTRAFVRPSSERVDLDGGATFEMVNHSHQQLQCGHWYLYKLLDGEWFQVDSPSEKLDCHTLPQGEREEWSLRAFNGEAVLDERDDTGHTGHDGLTRGHLGGGLYAAIAGYGHAADLSAALVELVGEPVTVAPTDDAVSERDGDTVSVTVAPDEGGDGDRTEREFVLTRADDADERVIAEQVMRNSVRARQNARILRNAIPFFESGVERVVVRAGTDPIPNLLDHDETRTRFRFRRQDYEIKRRENEG